MRHAEMLAEYLRLQAKWRGFEAERYDDDRLTRSGLALLDAASLVERLSDDEPRLSVMAEAGYFADCSALTPGAHGRRLIRLSTYPHRAVIAPPNQFLNLLALAAKEDANEQRGLLEDDNELE